MTPRTACIVSCFSLLLGACSPAGNEQWRQVEPRVLPQLVPVLNKQLTDIVTSPLSDDLDIAYVIDGETSYDFIKIPMLDEWEISPIVLAETAFANLNALADKEDLQMNQAGENEPFVMIETTDGYAAARILSVEIREELAEILGEPFAVAIPVRDFLIAWPATFSVGYQFVEQVQKEYNAEEVYRLTPAVFKVTVEDIEQVE